MSVPEERCSSLGTVAGLYRAVPEPGHMDLPWNSYYGSDNMLRGTAYFASASLLLACLYTPGERCCGGFWRYYFNVLRLLLSLASLFFFSSSILSLSVS